MTGTVKVRIGVVVGDNGRVWAQQDDEALPVDWAELEDAVTAHYDGNPGASTFKRYWVVAVLPIPETAQEVDSIVEAAT